MMSVKFMDPQPQQTQQIDTLVYNFREVFNINYIFTEFCVFICQHELFW